MEVLQFFIKSEKDSEVRGVSRAYKNILLFYGLSALILLFLFCYYKARKTSLIL